MKWIKIIRAPVLSAICLICLAFWGLGSKGLGYYDEAYNALEGRFLASGIQRVTGFAAERLGGNPISLRGYIKREGRPEGYYPSYGKPMHSAALALGLTVSRGASWGALGAVAVCGLLGLAAIWRWGRRMAGPGAGGWGAAVLGSSAYYLIYARQTLAEADSVAWVAMGLWVLAILRARPLRFQRLALVGAGVLFGLGFAANYRWFWIPALIAWDAWIFRQPISSAAAANPPPCDSNFSSDRAPYRQLCRSSRFVWVCLGFSLPLIFAELPGLALYHYFRRLHLAAPFETYWQQLARLYFFHGTSDKGFDLSGMPTYIYLLARWTSPLFLLMAAVGGCAMLARRSRRRRGCYLVVPPLVMLTFYSFYTYKFARFATLSLPFLAILAGSGIQHAALFLSRFGKTRRSAAVAGPRAVLGCLTLLAGLPAALAIYPAVSPWPEAARWLEAHGGELAASTDLHVLRAEYGVRRVVDIPSGLRNPQDLARSGVRWVVLGPLRRYWGEIPAVVRLAAESKPVFRIYDRGLAHEQYPFEHNRRFAETMKRSLFKGAEYVEIYDLRSTPSLVSPHAPQAQNPSP